MEYYDYKHWQVRFNFDKGYAFIVCPAMNHELSFGDKRGIYTELKDLEEEFKKELKCWVGYTDEDNWHIMKMFEKVGAKPFHKSLDNKVVWFKKEL